MSAPDQGFWQWIIGAVLGVIGTLFGYHKYLDSRFEQKADKTDLSDLKRDFQKLDARFDVAEAANEKRHRELLMHLLGRKSDG